VTAIGGGDLCLATSAARGVAARDVERALHEAIVFGITLFDVAADADSEKLAGNAVRAQRVRDRVVVATRVPVLAERPGAPRRDVLPERLPPPYVQDRVEATLRASRLEVLPLMQLALHPGWLASPAWPELVGTCARLIREGKVLAWGAMLDEPGDEAAAAVVAEPWLAAVSVVYSVCDRRAEPLFAAAAARNPAVDPTGPTAPTAPTAPTGPTRPTAPTAPTGPTRPIAPTGPTGEPPRPAGTAVGVPTPRDQASPIDPTGGSRRPAGTADQASPIAILARQPLAGGALAGTLGPGVSLPPRDDRNALDTATLERIAVAVARLAALVKRQPPAVRSCDAARQAAELAARPEHLECNDVAELALRFAIDRAGVALPRLHRREHLLAGIAAAAAPPLPAEIVARILDEAS
jgi:aryl-alcohol dehydrogenase-like predicted oxidoreductase